MKKILKKKKIIALLLAILCACTLFVGCTEANRVNYNITEEAEQVFYIDYM